MYIWVNCVRQLEESDIIINSASISVEVVPKALRMAKTYIVLYLNWLDICILFNYTFSTKKIPSDFYAKEHYNFTKKLTK